MLFEKVSIIVFTPADPLVLSTETHEGFLQSIVQSSDVENDIVRVPPAAGISPAPHFYGAPPARRNWISFFWWPLESPPVQLKQRV